MKTIEILVIGAGPAGLMAAIHAAEAGAQVLLVERADRLGGQLIKQTHKFFGPKPSMLVNVVYKSPKS